MNNLKERLERIEVEERVLIPTLDGSAVAETITVKVPAWRDPKDGEIYFDGEATAILDRAKARHMGLLSPDEIKKLRQRLRLTQKEISELLQIGEKTWTRWESGRERPSRSMNILLSAVNDGRLDAAYLQSLRQPRSLWAHAIAARNVWHVMINSSSNVLRAPDVHEHGQLPDHRSQSPPDASMSQPMVIRIGFTYPNVKAYTNWPQSDQSEDLQRINPSPRRTPPDFELSGGRVSSDLLLGNCA